MIWRLRQEIEDALWAAAKRRLPAGALVRKRLLAAVTERSRLYTSERDELGEPARGGASDLAARALFFTIADAAKISIPLGELARRDLLGSGRALDVLDLGAGAGAMTFGALSFFADRGSVPPLSVHAIDRDRDALALFAAAFSDLSGRFPGVRQSTLETEVAELSSVAPRRGGYDLVFAGSVLNELDADAATALTLRALECLRPKGALVIIEPALRETSRQLHVVRDRVIEAGASVFAPCTRGAAPCPALADERDWCHDERPLELPEIANQMANATGLRDGQMKMSYLVLRREPAPLVEAGDELVALRIVSRPRRGKGERDMFVCGDEGRRRLRLLKRHRDDGNRALERSRRGDVVLIPAARDEPELVDVVRGDALEIVSPAE